LSDFLQNKFLRICPYGKQYLHTLVVECERVMLITTVMALAVVILWTGFFERSSVIYLSESIILAIYLVVEEVPNYLLREKEDKLYKELLIFFSRVKHQYSTCKNMANAVVCAAEEMSYEIQRLSDEIYHVLTECDRKDKVREYIESHSTNRYINLFFILAYEVSEQGDVFFNENIEYLRLDLMEEIYRKKKRQHEFAGYSFVTTVPFFMMPLLKYWGMEFAPELDFFYSGTGVLLETVTFFAALIIYKMIYKAKEIVLFETSANETDGIMQWVYECSFVKMLVWKLEKTDGRFCKSIRGLILRSGERTGYGRICFQMIAIFVSSCLLFFGFFFEMRERELETILGKVESIDTIAPVAGSEKKQIIADHILDVTKECLQKGTTEEEEIRMLFRTRIQPGNASMEQEAIKEIKRKLSQYQKARVFIDEHLLSILFSIAAAMLPVLRLQYQIKILYDGAEYEVRQMQTIILMERKIHGNSVIGLLEDMELFSGCFQRCLKRCINSYGMGAKDALLKLKEEGKRIHESFEELADAFLAVDAVGIETAFDEVESNRRLLEKMSQLEAEISIEKKKDSTDLLSRIPAILAVGAYFIVPFFLHSLRGVFEVFDLLENLQL